MFLPTINKDVTRERENDAVKLSWLNLSFTYPSYMLFYHLSVTGLLMWLGVRSAELDLHSWIAGNECQDSCV